MDTLTKCAYPPCNFRPKSLVLGYCLKHQRQRIYAEGIAAGKHYCRFFFRGCESELPSDKKTCESCLVKKSEGKQLCAHKGCKFHVTEERYCGKHERDKYRDEEKKKGIRYCDIDRGCFELCRKGKASCDACLEQSRQKEKGLFDRRKEIFEHLREAESSDRLCLICGTLYESFHTVRSRESTRCKECQGNMREIDEGRSDRERHYKKEMFTNINTYYDSYTRNALRRNFRFELTNDQFEHLVKQPCFYCGHQTEGYVNGIDRVNNDIGYTVANCKPCCEICNRVKHIYHPKFFIEKAICIANGTKPSNEFHKEWNKYDSLCTSNYAKSMFDSKERNMEFHLTHDQWKELTSKPCYLCGFNRSRVGIDRFDNTIRAYTYDNCRPCCKSCNISKAYYSYEELTAHCTKIKSIWPDLSQFNKIYQSLTSSDPPEINKIVVSVASPPIEKSAESESLEEPEINEIVVCVDVPPNFKSQTTEPSHERWNASKLYKQILAKDTKAFEHANHHVLTSEKFESYCKTLSTLPKEEVLSKLKTFLNTLRVRRTRHRPPH